MAIKGSLVEASLPEVIQLLAYSLKSGCLSVTDGRNFGNIFLQGGNIIYATILKRGVRLGDSLLGRNLFDKSILKKALSVQKEKKERLGEILIEMGAISRQILEEELKRQIEDAIFTMLTWDKGYFNFEAGLLPSPREHTIQLSAQDILLGSARRIATWKEIQERMPDSETILIVKEDGKNLELTETEKKILGLIDGEKSVDEVVKKSGIDFKDACKAVYVLLTAGVIEQPKTRVEKKPVSGAAAEHMDMGLALYQSNRYDEAEREFKKVADDDPDNAEALFYLGMIELMRGNDDGAKEYLGTLLQKERRVSVLVNLGYLFSRMKRFEEARDLLEEARESEPDNLKIILNLAIANYHLNELDVSSTIFKRSLDISKDIVTPYLYLSLISAKTGDVDVAIDWLSDAVQRFPRFAAFKNNLGLLYENIGNYEDAEDLYQEALSLQPGDTALLRNIANLYYQLGFYGVACDYFEQIPDSERDVLTLRKLGRVYLLKGDEKGALSQLKNAQVLDPQNDRLRQDIEILSDLVSE